MDQQRNATRPEPRPIRLADGREGVCFGRFDELEPAGMDADPPTGTGWPLARVRWGGKRYTILGGAREQEDGYLLVAVGGKLCWAEPSAITAGLSPAGDQGVNAPLSSDRLVKAPPLMPSLGSARRETLEQVFARLHATALARATAERHGTADHTLSRGLLLRVRAQGEKVQLIAIRSGAPVGDEEQRILISRCGIPAAATRQPTEGQDEYKAGQFRVAWSWSLAPQPAKDELGPPLPPVQKGQVADQGLHTPVSVNGPAEAGAPAQTLLFELPAAKQERCQTFADIESGVTPRSSRQRKR